MKNLNLNLKNMIQRYYDSKADQKVWDAYYVMYAMGFLTRETWNKFYEACKDWVYDEEKHAVIEMFTDKVVRI